MLTLQEIAELGENLVTEKPWRCLQGLTWQGYKKIYKNIHVCWQPLSRDVVILIVSASSAVLHLNTQIRVNPVTLNHHLSMCVCVCVRFPTAVQCLHVLMGNLFKKINIVSCLELFYRQETTYCNTASPVHKWNTSLLILNSTLKYENNWWH